MGGETGHSEASRKEGESRNNQVRQEPYLFPLYQSSYRAKMIGVDLSEYERKVNDLLSNMALALSFLPAKCSRCPTPSRRS